MTSFSGARTRGAIQCAVQPWPAPRDEECRGHDCMLLSPINPPGVATQLRRFIDAALLRFG